MAWRTAKPRRPDRHLGNSASPHSRDSIHTPASSWNADNDHAGGPHDRQRSLGSECGAIALDVAQFHAAFRLPRANAPTLDVPPDLAELRVRLLREEVDEFADASAGRDLVEIADALADLVYVAYGSAVTYGIDLDAVLAEVHRSNMSKLGADGQPVMRADGKVLKSERYTPPDVAGVLRDQRPLPW